MPSNVKEYADQLKDRCLLVKNLEIVPIEAIVRGYISGSAWKDYQVSKSICTIPIENHSLLESEKLPKVMFTPSTKAEEGSHDENIHPNQS